MTVVRFIRAWAAPLGIVLVGATLLAPALCRATTVVVPDDFPTIQAAIGSPATRILVRNGSYGENVSITRGLSLEPLPHGWDGEFNPASDAHPTISGSVSLGPPSDGERISIVGFHVTGQVTVVRGDVKVAECQIDGGIVNQGEPNGLSIRGCIVRGGINASGVYGDITGNTVLGGGITTRSSAAGCCMAVLSNYVVGPATVGISLHDGGTNGVITGNTVTACEKGIVVRGASGARVTDNIVTDCTGNGYESLGSGEVESLSLTGNVALRCGGNGFDVAYVPRLTAVGNEADDCAGYGIRLQGCGSLGDPSIRASVTDNRTLRAGLDGIHADGCPVLSRNIVGRSRDRGFFVASAGTGISVDHNTSYWNGRAGFDLSSDVGGAIANNIAYANQHEGLVWSGAAPTLTCNDWFANVSGVTSGVAPGATDLAVDPFFCNVPQDDVHLAVFSPLRNTPSCGLIGALDVGCSEPTAVSSPPQLAAPEFACSPRPTTGGVRFTWRRLSDPGKVEVFDAAGARRWKGEVGKGTEGADWDAKDEAGNPVPAGVYFARILAGALQATTRVVVIR